MKLAKDVKDDASLLKMVMMIIILESEHRLLLEVGIYLIRSPGGHSSGQESTIWEIYYGIGKMGLVNKAIPNSQYGWKTRYILMQVKRHKTESLNWQNF